jgi:hypothetical protein
MKLVMGVAVLSLVAGGAVAQPVTWPDRKVRPVDAGALLILAKEFEQAVNDETTAYEQKTNTANENTCLEQIVNISERLFAEERQTWRLSMVSTYMTDPVNEEAATGQLFDELGDANSILDASHKMVGLTERFCDRDTLVEAHATRLEELEGQYHQIVITLQERIGPTRPGPPNPTG